MAAVAVAISHHHQNLSDTDTLRWRGASFVGIGELCLAFSLLCYASIAGKTMLSIMLSIMPASLIVLCVRLMMVLL